MFIRVLKSYTGLLRVAEATIVLQRLICNSYISIVSYPMKLGHVMVFVVL